MSRSLKQSSTSWSPSRRKSGHVCSPCCQRSRKEMGKVEDVTERREVAERVAKVFMKSWFRYERDMYGSKEFVGEGGEGERRMETRKMSSAEARRVEKIWSCFVRVLAL